MLCLSRAINNKSMVVGENRVGEIVLTSHYE